MTALGLPTTITTINPANVEYVLKSKRKKEKKKLV